MSWQVIKSSATELLQAHDLYQLPIDVDSLAERVGITVNYTALDDDYSGLLVIRDGTAVAHINAKHHPNRRRFSLAHEIGHFVLHENQQTSNDHAYVDKVMRLYHRADRAVVAQNSRVEREANVFAAELLMPEALLRNKVLHEGYDLEDEFDVARLAVVLRVSEQALSVKLTGMRDLLRPLFDETSF